MNNDELALRFGIANIDTTEYAILEEKYTEGEEINLSTSFNFGYDQENHLLGVEVKFQYLQNESAFLLISAQCSFVIDGEAWDSFISENSLILPLGFASHLAVITVGTTRGILHEKTKDTPFNNFIIPTINITELITEDVSIDLGVDTEE